MKSTIKALAELILQNVDILDSSIQKSNRTEPSLSEPYNPELDYPFRDPDVARASNLISAAAIQLLQSVRPPHMCLNTDAAMHAVSAAIRAASELNIPEILREAGPKGLHVKEIAKICNPGMESSKISTILRLLASRFIFKEVQPDVFANNKLSSILDKGISVKELQKPNIPKYDNPRASFVAILNHMTDDGLKSSGYLYESVSDPDFAPSGEPNHCSLNKAFSYDKSIWEFFEEPDQKERLYRFGVAMEGVKSVEPPDLATNGDAFTWDVLSENDLVVDVGGGTGGTAMQIAEMHPKLKLMVQDRGPVIADGIKRCEQKKKELLTSGRITFKEHDFFTTQSVKNPSVYLMKNVLHDWSDLYAKKILRHLREAAGPHTKLFILEKIIPYTCSISTGDNEFNVPGLTPYEMPTPLAIVGGGDSFAYILSLMMMQFSNGRERTIGQYVELFREAGWKIDKVFNPDPLGRRSSQIRAVPI